MVKKAIVIDGLEKNFNATFEYTISGITADKAVELLSAPKPDHILKQIL